MPVIEDNLGGEGFTFLFQGDSMIDGNRTRDITPPIILKAPHLVKRNGLYYLMHSYGKAIDATYHVRYSVGKNHSGHGPRLNMILYFHHPG